MRVENITKNYVIKNEIIEALKSFSYEFKPGTLYAVTGHSGSGKSTLINVLGLIEPPTNGKYYIDGFDVSSMNDFETSSLRMEYIGFVFQEFYLDNFLKAYENVMLPMLINNKIKNKKQKAYELLESVGLKDRINHFPSELSGGEKQRVAIARALANDPQIILADEPTGNLDEENEKNIFKLLKELAANGKCVIVVTHSNLIKQYADVMFLINKGKVEDAK